MIDNGKIRKAVCFWYAAIYTKQKGEADDIKRMGNEQ